MITSRTAYFSLIPRCSSTRCSRKFFRDYFARGGAKERRSSVVGGLPSTSNRVQDVTKPLGPDGFQELLPHVDTFIFDADGVLWLGDEVIPGSPTFINYLIQNNKRVIVLSNNATKSRAVYAKKLASLGFHRDLNKDYFVNPAAIVADALYRAGMTSTRRVYLIGAQGICDEMDAVGIEYFGHGPEPLEAADEAEGRAVVVGYEKHFNYKKLMKAANYLKHRHCLFLATNEDETCPGPDPDVLIPDAGPIVAAVRCASGREPLTVGKPYSPAFDYIKRRWNIEPNRTMMVGDRTNTDVKFGRDHGLKTLLVLSGCHQLEDIMHNHSNKMFDMVPDYFATCLGALLSRGQV
ncbi:PhosphoGlycolate Phosphatase [Trichostrongylus colubriformis]|uniref:PhosphoGlycolate Phosphatase n=1 Tax=Trichostrongylus colubriformis TaxID=6319 RepID=A0AAN8G7E6_TRICO